MLTSFEEIKALVKASEKKTAAVACAHDSHTLEAVFRASNEGILDYILIGDRAKIIEAASSFGISLGEDQVIEAESEADAAFKAVELIRNHRADFIQKGLMQTASLLKAVVNKDTGIGLGRPMSHTAILEIPGYPRLLGIADGGMIPAPTLEQKKAIAVNSAQVFRKLGYEKPMISAVCAAENVSPKIVETVDAAALKEACRNGELGDCFVEGPISIDLALNPESAKIKGYESPVCGNTDILLVPNMTAGNMTVKALVQFASAKMLGVVTGAMCPIALNSRSASFEEKYYSLLVCALIGRC